MSAWQEYKKKLGNTRPWDVVNPNNYADEETANRRMAICEECPRLFRATKQCKECGCLMNLKTKLAAAKCPIDKWGPIDK
jgi:hypothetical protein